MSDWINVTPQRTLYEFLKGGKAYSWKPFLENLVGVVVQTAEGEYLIGDLNDMGGVCDDCAPFGDEIVLKYKRIWDGEGTVEM